MDKFVYKYDSNTGEYLGTEFAYQSAENPKEYVLPNNATFIAPPVIESGWKAVFKEDKWVLLKKAQNDDTIISDQDNAEIKINKLKNQLNQMDYKVIKCFMAFINNKEMPYDTKILDSEMQAIRNQINSLERNDGE